LYTYDIRARLPLLALEGAMARKSTDTIKLQLRLPERLRRRLERAAETHDQSMNFEILKRLEESFQAEDWDARLEAAADRALRKLRRTEAEAALEGIVEQAAAKFSDTAVERVADAITEKVVELKPWERRTAHEEAAAQAPSWTEPAAAPDGAEELRSEVVDIIADLVRQLGPESESAISGRHNAGTEPDPEKVVDLTLMKKLEAAVEERVAERVEARIKSLQSAQEPLKREGKK
jgi:Arc-like DNA binding domain